MDVVAGGVDAADDPVAFGCSEPGRVGGRVGQQEEEGDAEQDGRDALYEEEPLPAGEVRASVKVEQRAGYGSHQDSAEWTRDVEAADRAGAVFRREPLHEIEDDSREEACLGHAEAESGDVELHRRADEEHAHGDEAPGEHDAGEPAAGAEAVQREVRRDLADSVAEEEDSRAEAVHRSAEVQGLVHLQGGEGDVGAVHVGAAVSEGDEGDEAPGGLAQGRAGDGAGRCDGVDHGHDLEWSCLARLRNR